MNLTPLQANMTQLDLGAMRVLFSYRTPVACFSNEAGHDEYYKTAKRWSNTTTRHINKWLAGAQATERPQEFFDNLISEVK
jgi:hypothetical protein